MRLIANADDYALNIWEKLLYTFVQLKIVTRHNQNFAFEEVF